MNDEEFRAAKERCERALAAAQRAQEDGTYHPGLLKPVRAAMADMEAASRAALRRQERETMRWIDETARDDPELARHLRAITKETTRLCEAGRTDEARALLRRRAEEVGMDLRVLDAIDERRGATLH